jgi:transposase
MSQSTTRIGIDLAKNVFQVCGTDTSGKTLFNKKVTRAQLPSLVAQLPICEIVMEACASAHYWSRVFVGMGHVVKMIHPAYVRPYIKTNKNDAADAEALCEAASRPQMRFVQPKTIEQQDIQTLHRIRERLVTRRTGLCNQIRGLLGEYGVVIPQGIRNIRKQLPAILEDGENDLTIISRQSFMQLYEELVDLDERIVQVTNQLKQVCETIPSCQDLITVPGVGPMVATALYAIMGSPDNYRNGREFSAFLGLVPRQYSTGGKSILGGISKRGDSHMRRLLIQGAQAALRHMHKRDDTLSRWACNLKATKGNGKAVVALANKIGRICWAVAATKTPYRVMAN